MTLNNAYGPHVVPEPPGRSDDIEDVYTTPGGPEERAWRMEGKMSGAKIIEALREAADGNLKRVRLQNGQTWVCEDTPSPQPPDDIKALVEELRHVADVLWLMEPPHGHSRTVMRAADALERQVPAWPDELTAEMRKEALIDGKFACGFYGEIMSIDLDRIYAGFRRALAASPTPPSEGGAK